MISIFFEYISSEVFSCVMPGEVTAIRSMAPVNLIVYYPETKARKEELEMRVADIHAASVIRRLKALNCPAKQKLELLDAIINTVKKRSREQER